MQRSDWIQIGIYILTLAALAPLLGAYMARVFLRDQAGKLESAVYRLIGIRFQDEMDWKSYGKALLCFNALGFAVVYLLLIFQFYLPFNPQRLSGVSWHLAFNIAVSFMTNTNWQSYAGETTVSYFVQMLALTTQNFVSAATGMAVFIALAKGIRQKNTRQLGNFWVDMTRSIVYILLPLSTLLALVLVSQGVVQNFAHYTEVTTLEGAKQIIPMGPAASQIAIKQLGTNGGGFFNANSAHPLENPTPFSNFLQMISLLLIPAALAFTYGHMVRAKKQGRLIFAVMLLVWGATLMGSLFSEIQLGTMEGKEVRFGFVNSLIWSTATTAASNGSVNAMHASLSPLAGGLAMFNIMLGEIIFGGVGSGMYGMLLFILLTVFLVGLMVGRTPEYLGKKIEAKEIRMVIIGILLPCVTILLGAGLSCVLPIALSSLANKGPHGLSEILYAFSSAGGNNGSAFAGLNANTVYYNLTLALAMLFGRFGVILPVLYVAGSLSDKKISPPSPGTFVAEGPLFATLLIGVILIVGALTFLPALSLGPIIEHFLMLQGRTF